MSRMTEMAIHVGYIVQDLCKRRFHFTVYSSTTIHEDRRKQLHLLLIEISPALPKQLFEAGELDALRGLRQAEARL